MAYIPDRGDAIWLEFTPQAGRRPALVLSPKSYNNKVGLLICRPVTTQMKGYPFEVQLLDELDLTGVILSDQVKSLDWKARKAVFITQVPHAVVEEVLEKLNAILQ